MALQPEETIAFGQNISETEVSMGRDLVLGDKTFKIIESPGKAIIFDQEKGEGIGISEPSEKKYPASDTLFAFTGLSTIYNGQTGITLEKIKEKIETYAEWENKYGRGPEVIMSAIFVSTQEEYDKAVKSRLHIGNEIVVRDTSEPIAVRTSVS